ncbi:MAG: SNF2-related protein [Candidatus Melainabacteria bacterium]|nr:SNF2-related protein [Candidatus Melainabacteria bacterium]
MKQTPHHPSKAKPVIEFNFGYVKQKAKPGSWRRGYNYFRTDRIESLHLTTDGVEAKVKGNFKEAYVTKLIFEPDDVGVDCSCPLEEEWCKHAVGVALKCVEQHLWEQYWRLPAEDEVLPVLDDIQGSYLFQINEQHKPKFLGLRIIDRKTLKPVKAVESLLRAIVSQENFEFNEAEKREFSVMQHLLKNGFSNTGHPEGWFNIPLTDCAPYLQLLAQVEETHDKDGQRLIFEQEPLRLVMGVNVSLAGNVLVSLHWHRHQPKDVYPLEDVQVFARNLPWGRRRQYVFPLSQTLENLPKHLTKSTFTDIRDADGGKFMYEELPKLRDLVQVDAAAVIEQLELKRKPPEPVLTIEMVDNVTLRLRCGLYFLYDGVKVPFSKTAPDTPYVMVVKKETETIYWVRRDLKVEHEAYKLMLDNNLESIQTQFLMAEGDNALDFYNVLIPKLKEQGWIIRATKEEEIAKSLKTADKPLKIRAVIGFSPDSVDHFIVEIYCAVGQQTLDLDEVQHHLLQGDKYFFLNNVGFVEVPLASLLQFSKTMQAFDAEEISRDVYKIQTYKVGLIAELEDQGVELKMSKKFKNFWNVMSSNSKMEELTVPEGVQAELRPYQKRGFNWLWFLYNYGLNGILADDMGLGKTIQALVMLQQGRNSHGQKPSLIVCPTSVVFNWIKEAERFTPDLNVINLTGAERFDQYKKIKKSDLVVTSYAILRRDINAIKNYPFRYCILDESQNIKNYGSQTAQAAKQVQCAHRLALSGTPIENRLSELWSVFDFLMPGFLYDIDNFKHRYITPIEERGNRDAERRLKKQVFPFLLRRMKRDVMHDLPPKIEHVSYCEMTDAQYDLYMKILEETREEVMQQVAEKGIEKSSKHIFSALLRLRQVCCHPRLITDGMPNESGKFEALEEMLEDIIANGHRVLLFSQFVEMLKIIRQMLERKGIKYEYLTGQTKDRQGAVERFNHDASIPIFLISLKAGGTGLNLTGADFVIHYDPWWNPAAEEQATDRAHRIGQNKTVFVYRLITRGTVEEKIMKLKERKKDLVDSIIAADRSMGKMLTFEDLKEILNPEF